jgi:hypothetical protein
MCYLVKLSTIVSHRSLKALLALFCIGLRIALIAATEICHQDPYFSDDQFKTSYPFSTMYITEYHRLKRWIAAMQGSNYGKILWIKQCTACMHIGRTTTFAAFNSHPLIRITYCTHLLFIKRKSLHSATSWGLHDQYIQQGSSSLYLQIWFQGSIWHIQDEPNYSQWSFLMQRRYLELL